MKFYECDFDSMIYGVPIKSPWESPKLRLKKYKYYLVLSTERFYNECYAQRILEYHTPLPKSNQCYLTFLFACWDTETKKWGQSCLAMDFNESRWEPFQKVTGVKFYDISEFSNFTPMEEFYTSLQAPHLGPIMIYKKIW